MGAAALNLGPRGPLNQSQTDTVGLTWVQDQSHPAPWPSGPVFRGQSLQTFRRVSDAEDDFRLPRSGIGRYEEDVARRCGLGLANEALAADGDPERGRKSGKFPPLLKRDVRGSRNDRSSESFRRSHLGRPESPWCPARRYRAPCACRGT